MKLKLHWPNFRWKEFFVIVILNSVVFIFYAFDKRVPGFEPNQFLFFLNFAIAGLVINYFLLPVFLYKKIEFLFFLNKFMCVTINFHMPFKNNFIP